MRSLFDRVYLTLLLAYVAILPVAGMTALRNVLLLVLFAMTLGWCVGAVRRRQIGMGFFASAIPVPVLLWAAFICLLPLWVAQPLTAWANLKGDWGLSLLTWFIGFGAVWILGRNGPGIFALSVASAFLAALHLLLACMAWAGLFGAHVFSDMPAAQMWAMVQQSFRTEPGGLSAWPHFPWGFRGFDPMHGNLGYTVSQAIALSLACVSAAMSARRFRVAGQAVALIALCFFSIAVANSRGNIIYSILLVVVGFGIHRYIHTKFRITGASASRRLSPWFWGSVAVLVAGLSWIAVDAVSKDPRWNTMVDKIHAGFLVKDPVDFVCNGLQAAEQNALRQRIAPDNPSYANEIIEGLASDGGRVILMRVGWEMVLSHPRGVDGSRRTYEKLMAERCGHTPVFAFSHAHQAWFNLSLAMGWAGAVLLASVFVYFAYAGARALQQAHVRYWGFALLLLSVYWLLRGLVDAVYQEHYLQMQALLLAYLWGQIQRESRSPPAASDIKT